MEGPSQRVAPPQNGNNNNQRQHGQWRSHSQRRRRNNSQKHGPKQFKQRNGKRSQPELGYKPSSYQDLQREGRKRKRRYYGPQDGMQHIPSGGYHEFYSHPPLSHYNNTVSDWYYPTGRALRPPAAPTPAHLLAADGAVNILATPVYVDGKPQTGDKLEAEGLQSGLDYFATNADLVIYDDSPEISSSEGEMGSHSLSGGLNLSQEDAEDEVGNADGAAGSMFGEYPENIADYKRICQRNRKLVREQNVIIEDLKQEKYRLNGEIAVLKKQVEELAAALKTTESPATGAEEDTVAVNNAPNDGAAV